MGTTITAALPAPPGAHAQSHSLPASDKHTPPAPPGGPATAGFFAVVDQVRAFLAAEAVADGWAPPRSEGAGEQGGADGAVELARAGSSGGGRSRPPPDWDWVAGQLLPLLQQYSAGLSEPVIRTAIWQAWRMLPDGGHADPAASTRWTPWAAATNPGCPEPATLEVAVLGGRPADPATGLPAALEVVPTAGGVAPPASHPPSTRAVTLLLHSSAAGWVTAAGLAEPGEEGVTPTSPLVRGCVLRLGGVRPWRPVVPSALSGPSVPAAARPPVRFLPTPAVVIVARDRVAAVAAARRLALAATAGAAKVVTPAAGAAGVPPPASPLSFARPPAAIVDGVVVGIGPPEAEGSAAYAQSRTGAARAVWLGEAAPGGEPAPTPLLLLDGWAAGAATLAVGDRLVLLGAGPIPPAHGSPPALELREGAVAWVVPGLAAAAGEEGGGTGGENAPAAVACRPGTAARAPLASLTPGTRRVALAGIATSIEWVHGGGGGGPPPHVRLGLGGEGEGTETRVVLCIPVHPGAAPCPAARAALAARPGDAVIATCPAARLVRGGGGGGAAPAAPLGPRGQATAATPTLPATLLEAWPSGPASPLTIQSLPRLPALLASPALWEGAAQGLAAVTAVRGGVRTLPAPALALCRVGPAPPPAFAIARTHASCGRPLHRAIMWDDDDDFGGGGGGGAPAPSPAAIPLSLTAAGGGLADAAPTQWGAAGASPGAAAGVGAAHAGAGGGLWSCGFCGVDCAGGDVGLTLTATAGLVGGGGGGDGSLPLPISASGPAAAALAGGVAAEFLAWTPERRADAAADLVGKAVRAVVLPDGSGGAEVAGVMLVLED